MATFVGYDPKKLSSYFDYFADQAWSNDESFSYDAVVARARTAGSDGAYYYNKGKYDEFRDAARKGYNPNDFSEANLKAAEKAYADYLGAAMNPKGSSKGKADMSIQEFIALGTMAGDLQNIRTQYGNAKMQGVLADIETGKLRRKQFEQMRKIATEGNEEASEDQKPTGKASVLLGSNIPERKQKRTSTSRDAGTARAKVKVQAKGINI